MDTALLTATSGIYRILNTVNGNAYVGSAVNLKRRAKDHLTALRRGLHHCPHLQNAWIKYGSAAFKFELLNLATPNDLLIQEQHHIDRYPPSALYNICRVAYSHLGVKRSAESIARMRQAARTRRKHLVLTPEHRANIGLAGQGRKASPATIERIRAIRKRDGISPDTRAKMSAARRGKPGKKHIEETKRKIAESHKGLTATDEARSKMSLARRLYHAKKQASS